MYDFSGTGKNGGFVYQFDFRIRQICFKATGQSGGFLKTAMITDITARYLCLLSFFLQGKRLTLAVTTELGRRVGIYPSFCLSYRQLNFLNYLSGHSLTVGSSQLARAF